MTTIHLLVVRFLVPEARTEPFIAAHVSYLDQHHADGVFLASGPTVPSAHGGAIVAAGVDRAAIERISAADPFVAAGVARHDITTIAVQRHHRGLDAVLAGSG